jgi:hypothetical protein
MLPRMTAEAELIPPEPESPLNNLGEHARKAHDPQIRKQALALTDSGLTPAQIAKQLNIPKPTVYYWLESEAKNQTLENSLNLAVKFKNAANLFLDLAVKKAKKASFPHLMTASGIAVDKSQLLNNLPTSIHEERSIDSHQVLVLIQDSLGLPEPTPVKAIPPAPHDPE